MSTRVLPIVASVQLPDCVVFGYGSTLVATGWESTSTKCGRIVSLAVLPDGLLISVTETKVFQVWNVNQDEKKLELLESRLIPRRAHGLVTTSENEIIIGDKFGDVKRFTLDQIRETSDKLIRDVLRHLKQAPADSVFQDSYTPLLSVLNVPEVQDSEAEPQVEPEETEEDRVPVFLGHLASITCMKSATLQSGQSVLISADRDEKIIVAKHPEIHHILAICAGHTQFIIDVELLRFQGTDILASVSADNCLKLWKVESADEVASVDVGHEILGIRTFGAENPRVLVVLNGVSEAKVYDVGTMMKSAAPTCETIVLPTELVAMEATIENLETCLWIDTSHIIYRGLKRSSVVQEVAVELGPAVADYWKHDRKDE